MRTIVLAALTALAGGAPIAIASAQAAATLKDAYRDAFRMVAAINAATALGTD